MPPADQRSIDNDITGFYIGGIALTFCNAFILFGLLICRQRLWVKLGLERPIETTARIPSKVVVEVVVQPPPPLPPQQQQQEEAANILSGSFAVYGKEEATKLPLKILIFTASSCCGCGGGGGITTSTTTLLGGMVN
ncbi:kinesin-like protein KIF20B-like protein [Corchorus capsularis]|uniref:Kinesin-like protein KIF20B-like protein n=1 Tax=Corchorus capsularis TaxID=210143 RepID=A0A1R3GDF8_COCAP|nr:kinesin-like protein KIF20B-like protein [Corchorus capsularis]